MKKEEKIKEPKRRKRRKEENLAKSTKHVNNGKPARKENAKKTRKKKDAVTTAVLVVAACVFVFSVFMLADSIAPYFSGGQEYDDVKKLVISQEKVETDEGEEEIFQVDFDLLMEQNADTIAWIRFEEPAVISYPVVKSHDNDEYLTRTFSANDNKLGAIFMDMNASSDFSDRNTIIYGHNMKIGGEMFSQLNEYADESFCKEYPYFYIYTPDNKELVYQIFSAGIVKDTAENYKMTFASDEEYLAYLDLCKTSSNYAVDVELNADSKIVSLSTCTNVRDDERFLVQGVLIEEVQR